MDCSKSGDFFMHAVPKKGLDSVGYAAECFSKSIMAFGHARCVVRSDNEPSIVQLVKAAFGQVRLGGIDVVDEGAVPYDPQTNGQAESAVRLLNGAMRVHPLSLERRLKATSRFTILLWRGPPCILRFSELCKSLGPMV